MTGILTGNERVDISSALDVIGQVVFMAFSVLFLTFTMDFKWLIVA